MNKDNLVKQWDEYIESMGSVMGEVEHMAQQMRDHIEELEAKLANAERRVYNNAIAEKISSTTDDLIDAHSVIERMQDLVVANGKLESKLAKALEALEDISGNGSAAGRNPQLMADKARTTLAELKGENDE